MSDSEKDAKKEYEEKVKGAIALNPKAVSVFEKIHGYRDSNKWVEGAENRAMTLGQLQSIWEQVKKRCKKEKWINFEDKKLTPDRVTLYDVNKYIILPLTVHRKCSYVELVAQDQQQQQPQWFVSHWWGEPVKDFLACLQQHAEDHHLDDSTTYWVCAYANNQWDVDLGGDVNNSPFKKAIDTAVGTVSILDKEGVVFERIWCGYELYLSLLSKKNYKWCVYTSNQKTSVGLVDGIAPKDYSYLDESGAKWEREKKFPTKLIEDALGIDIQNAKASFKEDEVKIKEKIGNFEELNSRLRGRFVAAGIRLLLEKGIKLDKFLKAIKDSGATSLFFDFSHCKKFNKKRQNDLKNNINWDALEQLTLNFEKLNLGDSGATRVIREWHFDKIVDLSLSQNAIGDECAKVLGKALASSMIQVLRLGFNKIGDTGMEGIAGGLKSNRTLTTLVLFGNKISIDGAKSLAETLKVNKTLLHVRLDNNNIGDEGAIALAEALKTNTTLVELDDRGGNDIGNEGAKAFGNALKVNNTLRVLGLQHNQIELEGAESFANGLKANHSLVYLNFAWNRPEITGKKAIQDAWGKRNGKIDW